MSDQMPSLNDPAAKAESGKKPETSRHDSALISGIRTLESEIVNLGAVSVLPDYFVDRFVRLDSIDSLYETIRRKVSDGGGGSIRGPLQNEAIGGNAVNLGHALGRLGARVELFAIAEGLPADTLHTALASLPGVRLHSIRGRCGFTVALEFAENGRHVNAMVSDAGDLEEFSGDQIDDAGWEVISGSKIVAVLNWAANKRGTELCEKVFSFARQNKIRTFFDPSDVSEVAHLLPKLMDRVLAPGLVDIIGMNDNELRVTYRELCSRRLPMDYDISDLKRAALDLSGITGSTVDIHTRNYSLSAHQPSGEVVSVPCHKVEQRIVTGAGDTWNAADIAGYLAGWGASDRLALANAAAGLYVSRELPSPPTLKQIGEFLAGM